MENKFQIGDKVTRRNVNSFRYNQGKDGTIVRIDEYNGKYRYGIKWDEKARTGQQHSTISERFIQSI